MKRTKKLLSVFLCFVMVMTVTAGFAEIASAQVYSGTTGGLDYSLDTDTGVLTLSKTDGGTGRSAGYANSATKRAPWYNQRSYITSVVAEEGVIELGSYLFYNCINIASVSLADTVDTIGECCFRQCTSLKNVTFPSNCSWIWKEAFLSCTGLEWVIMPTYSSAYSGIIPEGMFSGCTSLESLYVGSGITGLGTKALYNCSSLQGVMWASSTINTVETNALYNVPSSCKFIAESELSSWCSSNGYTYMSTSGTCSSNTNSSSNLSYLIYLGNRAIDFSGSGDMDSKPWECVMPLVQYVNFSRVDGAYSIMNEAFRGAGIVTVVFDSGTYSNTIGAYAFADLFRCTYWLNIPEGTTSIGTKAFDGSGFNYITIASNTISMASDAFTLTGFARFYGKQGSGVREFVENGKSLGNDWYYYCYGDTHIVTEKTIAPTCTEQGYDVVSCDNCDLSNDRTNFTDALGHLYEVTGVSGSSFLYKCNRCGATDLVIDSITVGSQFESSISRDNETPYYQSNYNGVVDVRLDGYVNSKDFALITDAINKLDTTNRRTVITESTKYQTIEGFGASGAWTAQDLGSWENLDDITAILYNKDTGIGLNVYRYNLGAGSNEDTQLYEVGKRARCFLQSDGTYNWDNDPGAMATLASVQSNNPDVKITLFCNSAPVSLTDNGKAYCSTDTTSNLSEDNYQAFTDYVLTCTQHFRDLGYNVTEVSPINEPEWGWACWQNGDGTYSMNQEGCHWEPDAARTFYNNYFIPAITSDSRFNGNLEVSVWESGQINHSWWWTPFLNYFFSSQYGSSSDNRFYFKNQNIRNYVDALDVHSYWASESDRRTVASQLKSSYYSCIKKVKCSEYCQMTNDGNTGVYDLIQAEGGSTNGMTIDYGIALANIMYQDLTILNAVEWDWWLGWGYGIYPDSLVYVNRNDHDDIQPSKRTWCMGNYSKFIEEGAQRVEVSTESSIPSTVKESAYLNPDGSVVVVYINSGTDNQYTAFDASTYSTLSTYVTDETRDLRNVQNGYVDDKAVLLPARSVTTVVLYK